MILDSSYFKGKIQIATAISPSDNIKGDTVTLDRFIKKYEPSILVRLLGYELSKDLTTHTGDTTGKYFELLKGKEYTKDGKLHKWKGLIYEEEYEKFSLLADYVYYEFLLNKQKHLSSVGMIANESKNATRVNSTAKLVDVWNDFVNKVLLSVNGEVGLNQFMYDMNEITPNTYPIDEYANFDYKNHLGL